ncbi:MAG: sulfite exporter TauE/SafE family protein, partial [Hydrotalea sp.]|nr:sulfite exporter TauE/SafE family protein [Hydrotalea sp.]
MIMEAIISGAALGIVSSFHCVGMCGPIAFSLPLQHLHVMQRQVGLVLYNLGRISTYVVLGALFGALGRTFYVGGWQQWFSIVLGVIVLLFGTLPYVQTRYFKFRWIDHFQQRVQNWISYFLQQGGLTSMFFLGAANGLLPCGMVYVAITGALAAGTIEGGMLFMAGFGFGTFPAMLMIGSLGFIISMKARLLMRKGVPFFVAAMGIILILRGLNLNIPFISPILQPLSQGAVSCHQ